jgi:hypothetical protein
MKSLLLFTLLTLLLDLGFPQSAYSQATGAGESSAVQVIEASVDLAESNAPIHILPNPDSTLISRRLADGNDVLIYSGGFYLFQRLRDERLSAEQALLELQAQSAVVFYAQQHLIQASQEERDNAIAGVYLEGDVTCQIGYHKITTERLYYDFQHQSALILNGSLKSLFPDQNYVIHIRAEKIRQMGLNHFEVENLKISTDEFHQPHVWAGAKRAEIVTDDPNYPLYDLSNVTFNLGNLPVFGLPKISGNAVAPESPISSMHLSSSREHGQSLETDWPIRKIFGLPESQGVKSVLHLDGYSKRGPAIGLESEYSLSDAFGNFHGYYINDNGEDRLSRFDTRRKVEPERKQRGRVRWQHRQYFPDGWQVTSEVSYLSDRDYLESWEKREFDTKKEQETLLYLKKQQENWAFDFLSKWRLNDHQATQTQLPGGGFHLAGQDLFETLTYYQDTQLSRVRELASESDVPGFDGHYEPSTLPSLVDEQGFTFGVSRHELVLPIHTGTWNFSPTAIGTGVYDDSGVDGSVENSAFHGALGLRASTRFWHIDNSVKSRLWNLDRLRHIVIPEFSGFWVDSDLPDSQSQNVFDMALRQRWQTQRALEGKKHTVDFLRIDSSVTLVNNDVDDASLPNRFHFSSPEPQFSLASISNPDLVNLGLARREQINQNVSDHANLSGSWLISDSTAITGKVQYNLHDDILKQADVMLAVQRNKRVGFFLGNRFLREGNVKENDAKDAFDPIDSHFISGGTTYKLNRKYTLALAHQFDIEQGNTSSTQAVLIRKSPRWYSAFSVDYDANRDDFSISFSFWPEGLEKMALGSRRYGSLTR